MDTSKEFIKMCEKAEEIQEGHTNLWIGDVVTVKQKTGDYGMTDFVINGNDYDIRRISYQIAHNKEYWLRKQLIWLPRQDQLQEMIKDDRILVRGLLEDFRHFCEYTKMRDNESFEQLWLAFVMKEKYNKVWDGGQWTHKTHNSPA